MNVYVAETMEHPETGHWTLTGDTAPGHRGSCWSQKHPEAAEMGQKELQVHEVHDLSYIFYGSVSKPCTPVNIKIAGKWMFIPLKMVLIGIDPYSYHYASLCFTVTSTQQSSAPIGGRDFSAKQIAFSVTKGTLAQCRHEGNVGRAILLGTNVPSLQVKSYA